MFTFCHLLKFLPNQIPYSYTNMLFSKRPFSVVILCIELYPNSLPWPIGFLSKNEDSVFKVVVIINFPIIYNISVNTHTKKRLLLFGIRYVTHFNLPTFHKFPFDNWLGWFVILSVTIKTLKPVCCNFRYIFNSFIFRCWSSAVRYLSAWWYFFSYWCFTLCFNYTNFSTTIKTRVCHPCQ